MSGKSNLKEAACRFAEHRSRTKVTVHRSAFENRPIANVEEHVGSLDR